MRQFVFLFALCLALAATAVAGCDGTYSEREQTLRDEIGRLRAELNTLKGDMHAAAKPAYEPPTAPTTGTAPQKVDEPSQSDVVMLECMKADEVPAWKQEFLGAATPMVTLATLQENLEKAESDINACETIMLQFADADVNTLTAQFPTTASQFERPKVATQRTQIMTRIGRIMAEIATFNGVIPSGYFAVGGEADRGYYPRHHVVKELVDFLEGHNLEPEEVKQGLTGKALGAELNRGVAEAFAEWKSGTGNHAELGQRLCEEQELYSAEQIKALGCEKPAASN